MLQPRLFTGTKAIPLNELPEEAWSVIQGTHEPEYASREMAIRYRKTVGVLYRCVQIRMNGVRRLPWRILDGNENEVFTSTEQKFPDDMPWLRRMKPLLGLTEAAILLRSEAFWLKDANMLGQVRDLRWLSPVTMKAKWDKTLGLVGFERRLRGAGEPETFSPDEIVYTWAPDPMHETKPDSPAAEAAVMSAGVLYNTNVFVANFFERGAVKATLLTVDGEMRKNERERLRDWWRRLLSGVKNAGNTEVIQSTVKPVIVGEGLSELSNTDLTGERREEIATALGVPHAMVFSNSANYATAQQDKENFYDETIIPECIDLIAPSLNDQLFEPLGFQFEFVPDALDIYQEDENRRSAAYRNYTSSGMKPSIAAEILGIDLPHNVDYEDLDPDEEELETEREAEEETVVEETPIPPTTSGSTAAMRQYRLDDLDKWRRKATKKLETKGTAICEFESEWLSPLECAAIRANLTFAKTREEIARAFDRVVKGGGDGQHFFTRPTVWDGTDIPDGKESVLAYKAMVLQLDPDDDEAEREVRMGVEGSAADELERAFRKQQNDLLSRSPTNVEEVAVRVTDTSQPVMDALRRALVESSDLGVSVAVGQLERIGFSFDWTLANTRARDWANSYAAGLITNINDTTRDRVRQAITQWISNGDPLSALVRELQSTFGRSRAELLASTEVTRAYAQANREAYRESKIVSKMRWFTAFDERVCPICGSMHGQEVGLDEQFSIGGPPAHPRCRCWIVPVVDRELLRQTILVSNEPLLTYDFGSRGDNRTLDMAWMNNLNSLATDWLNSLESEGQALVNEWVKGNWKDLKVQAVEGSGDGHSLMKILDTAPKVDGVLWRGITVGPGSIFEDVDSAIERFKLAVGTTIEWEAPSSLSANPGMAADWFSNGIVFEVKSKSARHIGGEFVAESISLPGTRYVVQDVFQGSLEGRSRWVIQLVEL